MSAELQCPLCNTGFSVPGTLDNCWNSSPQANTLQFLCAHCGEFTPLSVSSASLTLGSTSVTPDGLRVYVDKTYGVDIILSGKLYHYPKS